MGKVHPFTVSITATVALGAATAVTAALEFTTVAAVLGGLALATLGVAIFLADRRARHAAEQARRASDQARNAANRVGADVRRLETLVDAMQRRVVASIESARIEAADRHRESAPSQ